ncbi:MAG: tRNA pseudouridine(38-40) synthase TruA [Candidatus Lokiarchaeota archaeon]|nr:tRNA pseudouridine(38-40) synthase TruA [Candidatus Lokiarchaeota archaeon]
MEKTRYLFKFYYIGHKKYYGSQRQPNYTTIEDCLITALQEKEYIVDIKQSGFEVASRTDKFVSARGSAFSFTTNKIPILMEINSALPKHLGLWAYTKVPLDYTSRFNAVFRHYKYIIPYSKNALNIKNMKRACKALEGHHDFKNFSKQDNEEEKTVRDLLLASMRIDGNFIIFDFKSRAFLRQQIRRMIAKIFEVGLGIINYEDFLDLFNSSKLYSYQPADPFGLILWDINYGSNIQLTIDKKSKDRMDKYFREKETKYSSKTKLLHLLQHNNIS